MLTVQTSVLSRAFVLPKKVLEFCDFSANVNFYLLVTNAGASIKVSHGIHTAWQHTSERPDGDDDWLKGKNWSGRKYFTFDLSIWQLGIKLLMLELIRRGSSGSATKKLPWSTCTQWPNDWAAPLLPMFCHRTLLPPTLLIAIPPPSNSTLPFLPSQFEWGVNTRAKFCAWAREASEAPRNTEEDWERSLQPPPSCPQLNTRPTAFAPRFAPTIRPFWLFHACQGSRGLNLHQGFGWILAQGSVFGVHFKENTILIIDH